MKQLVKIQQELKAPKNQHNKFGNYKYRSCEDILEAVKPLLGDCTLTLSDEVKQIEGVPYIEASAQLTHGDQVARVTAQAGININRKGMDIAQSFGASSSYARKYALAGLFLLDDTKDADTKDNTEENIPLTDKQVEDIKAKLDKAFSDGSMEQYYKSLNPLERKEVREYVKELASTSK